MLIGMKPAPILEDRLGALLMAALLLITLVNVFVRYFTDQSFAWTEEISCFLMLVLAMAGSVAAVVVAEVKFSTLVNQRRNFLTRKRISKPHSKTLLV